MEQNNRHIRALELDKVLLMLAKETTCDDAYESALQIEPSTGLYEVKVQLQETDDAYMLMGRFGSPSFGGFHSVTNALRRADAGGMLTMRELLSDRKSTRLNSSHT